MIGYVLLVHCVPSGEVTNSNFIFDYLTRPGFESTELKKNMTDSTFWEKT